MYKAAGYMISRSCLLVLLTIWSAATYADNGNVFDRKIQIEVGEGTRYEMLQQVSEITGYLFIYDSAVINNDEQVGIRPGEYTVREAIYAIAGTRQLEMMTVGSHIALNKTLEKQIPMLSPIVADAGPRYYAITGTIFDLYSKEVIPSATVTLTNSSIGTVSNKDGLFRLSVPDSLINEAINISHIGYENHTLPVVEARFKKLELALEPKVIPLQEVVIRVIDPRQLIEKMLDKRSDNYSTVPVNITAFYREGVEHKHRNVDLTESVLRLYKTGFEHPHVSDQVKLMKMRRIVDKQERDTILTRVKSGVQSAMLLDLVKYLPDFLTEEYTSDYNYNHTDISVVNDRLVYVISFEQKPYIREPLFCGKLYVDTESYALVEARFEINPEYVEKATSVFVEKLSRKYRLRLRKAAYTVSYRQADDGVYYINHVRSDMEFRVRRRRHLFNSTLKVWLEMVNCKVDTDNVEPIPRNERLSTRRIFSETQHPYDAGFWGNLNVIVPEEELRELILNNLTEVAEADNGHEGE